MTDMEERSEGQRLAAAREAALRQPESVRCCAAIGAGVRERRWDLGLSRAEVCVRTGLSRLTFLLVENGWLPDDELELLVDDFARGLDMTAEDLWRVAERAEAREKTTAQQGPVLAVLRWLGSAFSVTSLLQPAPLLRTARVPAGEDGAAESPPPFTLTDGDGGPYVQVRCPDRPGAALRLFRGPEGPEIARTVLDEHGRGELPLPPDVTEDVWLRQDP